jgi:uncharacterized protein YegJ (DUF2314 family)
MEGFAYDSLLIVSVIANAPQVVRHVEYIHVFNWDDKKIYIV